MQDIRPPDFAPTWKWWLPPSYSSFGQPIDAIFLWIFWITILTFVGVELAMLYFCFKYRRDPTRKAIYAQGSHKLEVIWTVLPAMILVLIAMFSNATWAKVKTASSPDYPKSFQTTLKITAQQFDWNVTYPGSDGEFGTDDDFTLSRIVNVPYEPAGTEENVRVMLTSIDVIHSFFVPVLRVKQDAVPGFIGNLWFDVTRATSKGPDGAYHTADDERYEIACAELCGLGHSAMFAHLKALPRPDWEKWVADQSAKAKRIAEEKRKAAGK